MKSHYSILVVDDEEPIRKLIRLRFERENYTVFTAENVDQATAILAAQPDIAVVVTDIRMPGRTGLELTQEIKSSRNPRKVIVMTGHGEKSTAIEALRNGASDFLEKPFDLEEMAHSVIRTLNEFSLEKKNEVYLQHLKQQVNTPVEVSSEAAVQTAPTSNVIPMRREFSDQVEEKMNYTRLKKQWTEKFEQDFINKLLEKHQGNVTAAAKEAGLDRSNFLRLLRRHQIHAQVYRKAA